MKKLLYISFFGLFISSLSLASLWADESSLVTQYPASKGTYKQLIFQDLQNGTPSCTNSPGLMYVNPSGYNFEVCGTTTGAVTTNVTYAQQCFDRFRSTPNAAITTCPTGFSRVWPGYSDTFIPYSGITAYVTWCCSDSNNNFVGHS